jgi:glycosyltransferase involved in cell wall biosynthesis
MRSRLVIIENNIIATNTIREKLTRSLAEKYDVFILSTGTYARMEAARNKGFHVRDIKASTQNISDIFRYIRNLSRALKEISPDVCLTFTIRPAIWGNLVTRRLGIPTITNITGIGPLFARANLAYRAARLLYRFALRKTKVVFFQNNDDMQIFLQKGFTSTKIARRIPGSGIDYEFYSPRPKAAHGHFVFLFVSRLVKDKGVYEYVAAARSLKEKTPSAEFRILGPVWSQNLRDNTISEREISQWVQEGIIVYLGDATDVRPFMADADCIVLPSYREGSSNVLLEASSMEKPCITCDTTGCREIVEDGITGYLCKVKNEEDLAAKMKKMFDLPEETRLVMGKKGRQKVIREFDKQIVIDAYSKAIQSIIQSK